MKNFYRNQHFATLFINSEFHDLDEKLKVFIVSVRSMSPAPHLKQNQIFLIALVCASFALVCAQNFFIFAQLRSKVSGETNFQDQWVAGDINRLGFHFLRLCYSPSQTRGKTHSYLKRNFKMVRLGRAFWKIGTFLKFSHKYPIFR